MTRSSTLVSEGFVSGVDNRKSLPSFDKPAEQDSGISSTKCVSETVHSMRVSASAEESPNNPETTDNKSRDDDSSYLTVSMAESRSHTASTTDNSCNHISFSAKYKTANPVLETPRGDCFCNVFEEPGDTPVHSNTDDNSRENTSSSYEIEDSTNSNSQLEVSISTNTPPPHIVEVSCTVSQSSAQPAKQLQSNPESLGSKRNSLNLLPTQKPNSTPQHKSEQPQKDGSDEHPVTTPAVRDKVQLWVNNIFNNPLLRKSAIIMFNLTVLYVLSLPLQGLLYGSWCMFGHCVCFVILLILLLIYIIRQLNV